jgi:uncharacterized membrane protein
MLARLCRTITLEVLNALKYVVLTSLVAIISSSFILAQKAAISSAKAVSNAIIDVITFIVKRALSSLIHLATLNDKSGKRKNKKEVEEEDTQ